MRPSRSPDDRRPASVLGRLALPSEEPDQLALLRPDLGDPAADLRLDRVLHVRVGDEDGNAPLCRARGRTDGRVVVDPVRLGRRDPVAALAGDAGGADRLARLVPARARAADAGDRVDRPLRDRAHARLGPALLRRPTRLRPPAPACSRAACDDRQPRAARARARLHVHPLPERKRLREPARVPGLADHGAARTAVAAAGLGRAALLDPGADLGDPRRPGRGARRRWRRVARDRHVRPARCDLPRARLDLPAQLRAARAPAGDALADVTAALRVFFVGGLISYRGLFNWISPGMYVTTMLGSPLFQILFFTYLGRYTNSGNDDFFIVGNAVQVAA